MGRGSGRRKKSKSHGASKGTNLNANGAQNKKGKDSTCAKTEDTPKSSKSQIYIPENLQGCTGIDDVLSAPLVVDPSDPNELNFAALCLSDDKENIPLTSNPINDSILENGYHGLEAIDKACRILYPFHDTTPVITSPAVKVWLGGAMPLDYVKIFHHEGDPSENIVSHWHYVSYGLSDLHGDGRVHVPTGRGYPSGFGFELAFRLKKEDHETEPPAWPVKILNDLASYCFTSGKCLSEFDHIPWNQSLDSDVSGAQVQQSKIQHLVLVEDPKILDLDTPNGTVKFLQAVGIVEEELYYSRAWTTFGVVDNLLDHPQVGPLLITDMKRDTSLFDFKPELRENMTARIEEDGSNLTNITGHVYWFDTKRKMVGTRDNTGDEIIDHVFTEDMDILANFLEIESTTIHIDPIAAEILPVMVKGRLKKDVTFIIESPACMISKIRQTILFVPYTYAGPGNILVSEDSPMKGEGGFLQILCTQDLIDEMTEKFVFIEHVRKSALCHTLVIKFLALPLSIIVQPNYLQVIEQHKKDKELNLNLSKSDKIG